jgi:hypothetical protein
MSVTATSVRTAAANCVARLRRVSHEDLQVGALFGWTAGPMLEVVEKYMGVGQEVSKSARARSDRLQGSLNAGGEGSGQASCGLLRLRRDKASGSKEPLEITSNGRVVMNFGRNIWSALVIAVTVSAAPAAAQQPQKPNILVIMADHVGYWNISAYNRCMMGYHTPNIDRIANDGAIFTDYYGQQSCPAGRAAFITGQSPLRTGLLKLPAAKEGLSEKDPTIAELLKPQGPLPPLASAAVSQFTKEI